MPTCILIEDTAAFVRDGKEISGVVNTADLDDRVLGGVLVSLGDEGIAYRVRGGVEQGRRCLYMALSGSMVVACCRCLEGVVSDLNEAVTLRLFDTEEEWDSAFDESDGILFSESLDVRELIEDQILMALPASARHPDCVTGGASRTANNPFSVLSGLKKSDEPLDI